MTVLDSREQVGFGLGELTALAARLFLVGRLGGRRRMMSTIRVGVCLFILGSGACAGVACFDAGGRVDDDAGVDAEVACEAGEPCGVGEEGAGATCREKPSGGDVECRETECCNCRDDDGDGVHDYGLPLGGGQAATEAECQSASCQGSTVEETCSCTYDPDEEGSFDSDESNDSGVCTGQPTGTEGDCNEPENFEAKEQTIGDGLDNDCDGDTDEGTLGAACADDGSCMEGSCFGEEPDSKRCVHEMFVTSEKFRASFGPLEDADAECADFGGEGNWKALLSRAGKIDSTDPLAVKDRLRVVAEVRRPDGKLVAEDRNDLWDGEIASSVDLNEKGNDSASGATAWTGSYPDGKPAP
jgi:hypothetical protein